MKNKNIISPIGLKGNQINERMKELMGISSINENKSHIVVELTKMGPDNKAYAIIRENHDYYIKSTTKTSGLVAEDFKYIGGLQNKKQEAYTSYAKAIKHLNLRFNSLSESYNIDSEFNAFLDDNLLSEDITGFSQYQGNGFSNQGNMEGNSSLYEEEETDDEVEDMLDEEEDRIDVVTGEKLPPLPKDAPDPITERKLSISRAINNMDSIIDALTETKKKVYTLK
tara:strand:+ start:1118 stop:1795 length:678 start_codon:yes stop_codon:yes gene_type:complete